MCCFVINFFMKNQKRIDFFLLLVDNSDRKNKEKSCQKTKEEKRICICLTELR